MHSNAIDLAGGNFSDVLSDDRMGHNVSGILAEDVALSSTPPGFNSTYDPSTGNFNTASRLTCAGTNGCHGNRDEINEWTSVSGGHHGDDSILKYGANFTLTGQGTLVTTSYRFLYRMKGTEDSDWHVTRTNTDHNEYLGEVFASRGTTDTWANMKGTISELCSECHGNFHLGGASGIGSSSPWLRHGTDILIPNSGEFESISTTYSDVTPVARPSTFFTDALANASATVAAGTDRVMCLSCHRAHASTNYKILRWDYKNATLATAIAGCAACHTSKD
jgi:predicted CXXCH cytochrome family protein